MRSKYHCQVDGVDVRGLQNAFKNGTMLVFSFFLVWHRWLPWVFSNMRPMFCYFALFQEDLVFLITNSFTTAAIIGPEGTTVRLKLLRVSCTA